MLAAIRALASATWPEPSRLAARMPPASCSVPYSSASIRALWSPARQQRAEHVEHRALGVSRHAVVAPGLADQPFGVGAVAAREHGLRQRELALGRDRRFVLEPRPHRGVVAAVVPQRGLDAPAQEGLRRPARIGRDERAVALDRRAVVVAAQDQPFRELARDRIGDRRLRPAWRRAAFCLRTSSMTFSSASLSACEVDDVAATAAGVDLLARRRQGGMLAGRGRRRRGVGARPAPRQPSRGWRGAAAVACAAVSGRRCGRSAAASAGELLAAAEAPSGKAASPTASARLVASAVDRKAAARAEGSRLSSAAANHSIGPALGLFD